MCQQTWLQDDMLVACCLAYCLGKLKAKSIWLNIRSISVTDSGFLCICPCYHIWNTGLGICLYLLVLQLIFPWSNFFMKPLTDHIATGIKTLDLYSTFEGLFLTFWFWQILQDPFYEFRLSHHINICITR